MWRARWQVENLAGADRQVAALAVVLNAQHHFTLELIKELWTFVPVVIGARVGATDDHDDEIAIDDALVAHRRLQQMPVFVDPALQVEGRCQRHGCTCIMRSGSTIVGAGRRASTPPKMRDRLSLPATRDDRRRASSPE